MSGMITDGVKAVAGPVKTLVIDRIQEYLRFINTYEKNIEDLLEELGRLCSKKQDIDLEVKEGKDRLRVMTKETTNWMKNLYKLIERDEMKRLMNEDKVAEIAVKMMDQRIIKRLFNDDREIFDIVVRVVKEKCNQQGGDAEEDADYKKLAKIAREVIQDISEEFKKFMKTDDAAGAAVNLLNYSDLEKLMKDDNEMAMILIKAEDMNRQEVERRDHDDDEESCLIKHEEDVQCVSKDNIVSKKFGVWRERMKSLMGFLDDENFKKGLPDGANIGLEVMNVLSKEPFEQKGKSHRYCGWCLIRFKIYRHRHDMSESAEIMVNAIRSMMANCPQGPATRRKISNELETVPSEFMVGLESREELVKNILLALQDDKVDIIGVFGIGGGGKTTLAKEVAYKRATSLFDKRVVVEVSEAPNIKGIQEQIGEGINLPLDNMHTVAQRAQILYNGLKAEKTKILIILDNVWKKLKLNDVGIPLGSTKDSCCKLLITTRERQVCKVMNIRDANIFEVGLLNERESLNLFENQTGRKVGTGEFKPVADRLLRKCGGLPLAIVTSGCALKGKKLPMWCHFADTSEKPISSQVSNEYHEIYSILETSYKLIESEVKRIFFFLACLSPLDSGVTVEELMRYGIGLDLFQRVDSLSEAMEQASVWANELISSSLLLKGYFDGQVTVYDVVRASAISFADKGKDGMTLIESIPRWMCLETFEKFTAISLMSGNDFSRLSGVNAPMLEILLLEGDISSTTLTSDFFEGMKNLKVLCLSKMNFNMGLPESMGELKCLKTLHLQYCKLNDIKLIGKLVNLLVLSLRGSSLEELAVEIGELCKLRLLDMGQCKGVKSIPSNILSRLSHLEGLYMDNGYDAWLSTDVELNDEDGYNQASGKEFVTLSHLIVLEMVVSEVEQLLSLNNDEFVEKLGKFRIRLGDPTESYEDVSAFRYIFELSCLNASKYNSLRVLLKKTDCLLVNGCDSSVDNFVPQLDEDGFKDLKYLEIVFGTIKCLISSKKQEISTGFANLETLRLGRMSSLKRICGGKAPAGMFSNLRCLHFGS